MHFHESSFVYKLITWNSGHRLKLTNQNPENGFWKKSSKISKNSTEDVWFTHQNTTEVWNKYNFEVFWIPVEWSKNIVWMLRMSFYWNILPIIILRWSIRVRKLTFSKNFQIIYPSRLQRSITDNTILANWLVPTNRGKFRHDI